MSSFFLLTAVFFIAAAMITTLTQDNGANHCSVQVDATGVITRYQLVVAAKSICFISGAFCCVLLGITSL